MTAIPGITNTAGLALGGEKPLVQIAGNQQWLDSVTAGQILKGRIMRHYGDGRYGVSFSGQERIVDSAVTLSVGETLTGKVTGLSEKSVLMQIVPTHKGSAESATTGLPKSPQEALRGNSAQAIMEKFGLQLDQLQLSQIVKASKGLEVPELGMKVGFFVAKHGLPVSSQLIRAIYARINEAHDPFSQKQTVPIQTFDAGAEPTEVADWASSIELLKQFLIEQSNEQHDAWKKHSNALEMSIPQNQASDIQSGQSGADNDNASKENLWNSWYGLLLNAQTGAAYQHRFDSLPILINGKLIEFDVALFDHPAKKTLEGEVQSRYLKFSLTTDFGVVAIDMRIMNDRLNLLMTSENQWLIKEFLLYEADLTSNLADAGWALDDVRYEPVAKVPTPAEAIIEHVLEQDSLRMLV